MANIAKQRATKRHRRHARVRARVSGTAERPRLCVSRSLRHMYAQLIDDTTGKTLVSIHSKTAELKGDAGERSGKVADAYLLGQEVAKQAKSAGLERVVFDRAGYRYHGRVAALAAGARDGGLTF